MDEVARRLSDGGEDTETLKLPPIQSCGHDHGLGLTCSSCVDKKKLSVSIKQRLHDAVKEGDIDQVEELLDEPGADINATYYGENLLWTAIMNNQQEMATFLIDNGVDTTFKCCRVDIQGNEEKKETETEVVEEVAEKKSQGKVKVKALRKPPNVKPRQPGVDEDADTDCIMADVFVIDCRQLAYEKELLEIVNLIDFKQGCLLKTLKPPEHKPRLIRSAKQRRLEAQLEKDMVLPPDRTPTPGSASNLHRQRMHRAKMSSPNFQSNSNNSKHLTLDRVTNNQPTIPVIPSTPEPLTSHTCECGDSPPPTQTKHQSVQPRVRLTKTAVVRRNFLHVSAEDLKSRHNEVTDLELPRQRVKSTLGHYRLDRRLNKSTHTTILPITRTSPTMVSSTSHVTYTRRRPVNENLITRTSRNKSAHSYQHSARISHSQKFIGWTR